MSKEAKRVPVYRENPFFGEVVLQSEGKTVLAGNLNNIVKDESTQVIVSRDVVDKQEFLKIYEGTLVAITKTSRGAVKLFMAIVDKTPFNESTVDFDIDEYAASVNKSKTYVYRLVRELIENGFIAKSVYSNQYFVNINLVCKGDRLTILRDYIRKDSSKLNGSSNNQQQLPSGTNYGSW
jgi:hypothetical protein